MRISMEINSKDRAAVKIPPPLIFVACLGAGVFLEYLFPFRFARCAWTFRIVFGCFLIVVSGLIAILEIPLKPAVESGGRQHPAATENC
jgi:hypothetical protein